MTPSPFAIEQAGFASWPAFEELDRDGWILRCAGGCTKRANSVNPLTLAGDDMAERVASCEAFYQERFQPTIFRLVSFLNDRRLDSYLTDQNYRFLDATLVLVRDLDSVPTGVDPGAENRTSWFETFCKVSGADPATQGVHAQIIERIPAASLFTILRLEDEVVACGLGVIHQGLFGIFDIVTAAHRRNLGHGARLLTGMLAWAKRNGASHAYCQVVASNGPAIRLYEKMGYRRIYDYWYRKK